MSYLPNKAPWVTSATLINWLQVPAPIFQQGGTLPSSGNNGDFFLLTSVNPHVYYQYDDTVPPPDGPWINMGPVGNFKFGNVPTGQGPIQLFDTRSQTGVNLFVIYDPDTPNSAPLLMTDQGFVVKKDISVGGEVMSGQGALITGYGWTGSAHQDGSIIAQSPPLIELMYSSTQVQHGSNLPNANDMFQGKDQGGQIFYNTTDHNLYIWSGQYGNPAYQWLFSEVNPAGNNNIPNYDTLFLVKVDGCTPAHLDLGNLTIHGDITVVGSILNLATQLASVIDSTLHSVGGFLDLNPNASPTLAGLCVNGGLTINAPSQTGITLGNGTIYWQTATNPHVLEMNCGLIIDGALNVAGVSVNGTVGITGQITSSIAAGTAPLNVTSTTMCPNLNADMLDGHHASDFLTSQWNGGAITGKITIQHAGDAGGQFVIQNTGTGGNSVTMGIGDAGLLPNQFWLGNQYGTNSINDFAYGLKLGLYGQTSYLLKAMWGNAEKLGLDTSGNLNIAGKLNTAYTLPTTGSLTIDGSTAQVGLGDRDGAHPTGHFVWYLSGQTLRLWTEATGADKATFDVYGNFTSLSNITAQGNLYAGGWVQLSSGNGVAARLAWTDNGRIASQALDSGGSWVMGDFYASHIATDMLICVTGSATYLGSSITPVNYNVLNLGNNTYYFNSIWSSYFKYKNPRRHLMRSTT